MNEKQLPEVSRISRAQAKASGLIRYFSGVPCKRGHVEDRIVSSGTCVVCNRESVAKIRSADPEKNKETWRIWYSKNSDVRCEKSRSYYAENKQKVSTAGALYRENNRVSLAERRIARRKDDAVFAFNARARCMIRSALVLYGFKKNSKTETILGCSMAEFKSHIERQFTSGMGWHNMQLWEIDHIIPASSAKSQEEAESLNRSSNLRPLWRDENRTKSSKITHLL